ncbi:MAG: aldose epimerase family protein [Pseudomonadota bacterium]
MTIPLTLSTAELTATIDPQGARLQTLSFRGGPSLVLHADTTTHPAWAATYAGAVVGPVANRVRGGRVPIGGVVHQMPCNENGQAALHSGPDGLDQQVWQGVAQARDHLHLRCQMADGAGGLPGNRVFDLRYGLESACLTLEINGTSDQVTPMALAHHPYWRLGRASDHLLQVAATRYLPVDAANIPTGEVAPVAGTWRDHRTAHAPDARLDHCFCTDDAPHAQPRQVASLRGSDGLVMQIETTEPGLQVYAGAFLPALPQTDIGPCAGLALEPQGWPDAVNQPAFPSVLYGPARPYRQVTRYRFSQVT